VVSKYFYEKDYCVLNGILKEFTISFDEYVEKTSAEWAAYVLSWINKDVVICRYEELLRDTFSTLQSILSSLDFIVASEKINQSIEANTKEKMRKALDSLFPHNTL